MATTKITQNEKVVRLLADLLVKLVSHEVSVPQAVQMLNKFADSLPIEQRSDARAYLTDYVFTAQESLQKQKPAPQQQPATRPWQESNDDEIPWQEREPWRTIKRSLPPAMIDTEKERKVAWRIGFLMGYGAVNATAAAFREYGLTGGMGTIALIAWAYQQIRRR